MSESSDNEYVLEQVRKTGVKLIGLWFCDVVGRLKSVAITDEQLELALADGVTFDGASLAGLTRHEETDLVLWPDPTTYARLPAPANDPKVARMFCDLKQTDGAVCQHDPRAVLKAQLERARAVGYTFFVGCEVEYYYLRSATRPPVVLDSVSYFDVTPTSQLTAVRRETMIALEELGIAVESAHHEVGPGQYEVKLQWADALTMADALMTSRLVVKRTAEAHDLYASFMPKPLAGANGSGLHLTLSLSEQGENAFFDATDPERLAPVARHFVAGLLEHAPSITLITNQWVNSYKRLVPDFEAPTNATWAVSNWGDLVRVPKGASAGTHVEYRAPDPACNPYLAFAAILAAGLDGVARNLSPPPLRDPQTPHAEAGPPLPATLAAAIDRAAYSPLLREALGASLVDTLLDSARLEWREYHAHVSDWELERYLDQL